MKVYICGDKSNKSAFDDAEQLLLKKGYCPVNPLNIINVLPEEMTPSDITVILFEVIRVCDAIYLLHGWSKDLFARMERTQSIRAEKECLNGREE